MLDPQAPSCSVTAPVTLDFLEEDRQIQLAIQASLLGNSRGSRPKRETVRFSDNNGSYLIDYTSDEDGRSMRFRHLDPGGDPTYPIWDSGIQPVTRSLFADFKAEMTALRAKDSYSHHGNLDGSWGAAIRDPTGPISASRVDPGSQFLVADLTAGTAAVSSKSEPLASLDSHHGDLEVSNPLSRVVEDRGLQASMQPWVTQAFGPQKARKATSSGLSHRGMPKCSVNYPKSLRQSNAGLLERPNPEGLSSNTHGVSSQSGPFHYQNPAILDGVILPVVTDPKGRPPSKGSSSSSQRLEEPPQLLPLGDDDPGVLDKYSRARPGPPLDQDSGPLRRRHTGRPGENNSPLPRARANDKRGTRDAPEQTPSRASGILHRETSVNTDTVASSGSSTDGDEGTASDDLDGRPRLADMAGDFRQQSIAARAQKRRRLTAAHDQPKASGINASRIPAGRRSYRRILTGGIGDVALALNHVCSQTNRTLHCRGATATANFLYDRALLPFAPGANVVFLSHLIPKKYDISTRNRFLEIFKEQATYVPLCVMEARMPTLWGSATDVVWEIGEQLLDLSLKVQRQFRHALGPNGEGWPTTVAPGPQHPRALPVEIFEVIAENLPRDAVQNMRLVNHEFEKKISRFAFRSVVVPFKPKIYQTTTLVEEVKDIKGKGKEKEREIDAVEDCTRNERKPFGASYDPDTVHVQDGMRVFEQWGPEIKKFALTFEFGEDALKGLLPKQKSTVQRAFWGTYDWPNQEYSRYHKAAELEEKADEASAMTTAFSKLKGLQELGLSMSSGLGWLTGPDVSDRVKLFNLKPVVFGPQYALPDRGLREACDKWDYIVEEQIRASKQMNKRDRCFFRTKKEYALQTGLPKVVFKNIFADSEIRPPIVFDKVNMEALESSELNNVNEGHIDFFGQDDFAPPTDESASNTSQEDLAKIVPNSLTPAQGEWLMEMEWAQGAFLSSWCLAVLDNPGVFQSLRTFNIANLPSGLLPSLEREDIWRSLPSLKNLTVLVAPDWRRVFKTSHDDVQTEIIRPSESQHYFYRFLFRLFMRNRSIKTLKIGYVGNGEQAPGMFARNQNIIPAPIIRFATEGPKGDVASTISFPHIEHLILSNCWLTPKATKAFFADGQNANLQTVTLDSVSLTADARPRGVPVTAGWLGYAQGLSQDNLSTNPHGSDRRAVAYRSRKWLYGEPPPGCWADVINNITPGHGIARARYLQGGQAVESPSIPPPTALRSITFVSCGYVRLLNMATFEADQSAIVETIQGSPACLRKRRETLKEVMLQHTEDGFLGTIVPALTDEEEGCLRAVWNFKMGWSEEMEKEKWNVREDGMGEGGLGRFRGRVRRVL